MSKGNFTKDTFKLALGTTFTQVLGLVLSPIFARIFAPEAIGVATIFTALLGVLQVIVCLRYELAIMLPASHEEARTLLFLSLIVVLLVSGLTTLILWVGISRSLIGEPFTEIQPYLWIFPIALALTGISAALNVWNSRLKHFGQISIAQATNSLVSLGGRLVAGLLWAPTSGAIIYTYVFGTAVSTFYFIKHWRANEQSQPQPPIRWATVWASAKQYYKFPLYNTWSALLNTVSWQLPIFVLSMFFSPVIVGYYALSNRVISLPMSAIGGSIAQVFYQRASASIHTNSLASIVENIFRILIALGLFPSLVLAIVGDDLFSLFLGERWTEAGVYSQILALWTFFWFISAPLSSLYNLQDRQESLLGLQFMIFASRLLALLIGGWLGDPRLCLALFGFSGVVVYGYMTIRILEFSGVSQRKALQLILHYLLLFLPAGFILLTLKFVQVPAWSIIGAAVLVCGVYLLYLLRSDDQIRQVFQRFVASRTNTSTT